MSAEERKVAIVKAAMPLFARKGFAETTTKDLAKAAGVSEPLIYKHFPSKEALYVEIQNFSCNENDPVAQRLNDMKPSTSTLVHLVYFLMRMLVLGRPAGTISWDTRHRLMLKSLLEDGAYAHSLYKNRVEDFCSRMEACLDAAAARGDVVKSPVSKRNRTYFAQNVGVWLAMLHLPGKPPMDYKVSGEELLHQAVLFTLRGMGMTDKAMKVHFNPKALARSFGEV